MENNEIMQVATETMSEGVMTGTTGMDVGKGMLIGAGVTAAVFAGIKLVKKGIAAIKAKKENDQAEPEYETVDDKA